MNYLSTEERIKRLLAHFPDRGLTREEVWEALSRRPSFAYVGVTLHGMARAQQVKRTWEKGGYGQRYRYWPL